MGLSLPETVADVAQLEDLLSEATEATVRALDEVGGDLMLLGAGGKMGPTLARMARRASGGVAKKRTIYAVSRFSDESAARALREAGIEVIKGDLLDAGFVNLLPQVPNVIYMAGMKFGASENLPLTWAMNTYVPALVMQRFPRSRVVAFSTGNVYGLVRPESGGSKETDPLCPVGEYAMSALGRERTLQCFCQRNETPAALLRLNYANELRYGVLVDLCRSVYAGEPIDLSMGYVNVIWQGDANAMALCALRDVSVPAAVINIAGPEMLRVREVCEQFGSLLERTPQFTGTEGEDALLSNGTPARQRYGDVRVTARQMIRWIADWVARGGESLDKPTHFEVRSGRF